MGEDDDGLDGAPETGAKAKYVYAKQQANFNDDEAIVQFYEVYNDEEADAVLRGKAICRAAVLISRRVELEQIQESMGLIFACHQCEFITDQQLRLTVNQMIGNSFGNRDIYEGLLQFACEKVDRNIPSEIDVFVDLKIRQAENAIKYDHFTEASGFLSEAEEFCAIPPDENDSEACRRAIQIIVGRMELANRERNEDQMMKLGVTAFSIPAQGMTERQTAVLDRVKALQAFYNEDYQQAGTTFWNVVSKFSQLGLMPYVQECVPFWALAKMLVGDRTGIFESSEIRPLQHSALVAPFHQLHDAYLRDDVKAFKERTAAALAQFPHKKCDELVDRLRVQVLRRAILSTVKAFSTVSTAWIAKKLQSTREEVEGIVVGLILNGIPLNLGAPAERLPGRFDPQKGVIVMTPKAGHPYLDNVPTLLTEVEELAKRVRTRCKLPLEHRAWP